tara:strand:+ start:870 stop:1529 length:660 start_codon:yes stop_codon:yes gene_type:complete
MISHKNKYIFMHIPKTGGGSVENALFPLDWGRDFIDDKHMLHGINSTHIHSRAAATVPDMRLAHINAAEYRYIFGDEVFNTYYKFTFVRNPWDMLVSVYEWGRMNFPELKSARWDFDTFVCNLCDFNKKMNFTSHRVHDCHQSLAMEINGKNVFDYIGRFETLVNDFQEVREIMGLPRTPFSHANKSLRKDYREYYSDKAKKQVERIFKRDIDELNYSY